MNQEDLQLRYELVMERIGTIPTEDSVMEPYRSYFYKVAEYILLVKDMKFDLSLEELQEQNLGLYEDIYPENYDASYGNPAFAVRELGEEYGKLLSFLYAKIRKFSEYLAQGRSYDILVYSELFVEIYNWFENEMEEGSPKEIQQKIAWFYHDYAEEFVNESVSRQVDPGYDFYAKIIVDSDLEDLGYLYRYGSYIGENELKVADFLNGLDQEKIQSMADTYTEGYRAGFQITGKNLSIKRTVELAYPIGFERVMRASILNFRKMGLEPVIREGNLIRGGATSISPNEQYDFDHKNDEAVYLDKTYVQRYLDCLKASLEENRDWAKSYAGPAVVETFGQDPFSPKSKKENIRFEVEQQKMNISFSNQKREITNQYIKEEERSYTIIAYPIPEIGEKFEEIFEKTIELNTLDSALYQEMQQKIIDVLDQGELVHILGKGANRTDLMVALHPLKHPDKETIFENCVADVNIPVGEVFTSPALQGTSGTLHVTEVFLRQLKYVDLELKFQDGMVTAYSCKNFEDEEENIAFLKENLLHHHDSLPLGEFAIGTNTTAYKMGRDYGISRKLPILIAEKTGPHFAVGDTCYSHAEDTQVYNPNGKEIIARDNEHTLLRKVSTDQAYYNCHTDITIPYDELDSITVIRHDKSQAPIITGGKFVVPGTEELNEPLES